MLKFAKMIIIVSIFLYLGIATNACSFKISRSQPSRDLVIQEYYNSNNFAGELEDEHLLFMAKQAGFSVDILLYFYNSNNNRLETEKRTIVVSTTEQLLKRIVEEFMEGPRLERLQSVVSPEAKVEKVERYGDVVNVYVSKEFLKSEDLSIARAALVNTILENQKVNYVKIYVEGKELTYDGKDDSKILGLLTKYPTEVDKIKAWEMESINRKVRYITRELYFQDNKGAFLIPEIRKFSVHNNNYVEAIIGELLKGPVKENEGVYPVLPSGAQLLNVRFVKDSDLGKGVELYFSKEFKLSFDKDKNFENMIVGSLLYSLDGLPGVQWIKIYYQDNNDQYTDFPLVSLNLNKKFNRNNVFCKIGKKIKVYFSDKEAMNLVPEYRVIDKDAKNIEKEIINELIKGPLCKEHTAVIPSNILPGEIDVYVRDQTAFVNLPSKFNASGLGSTGEIMALYAIVNSLTDPINTENIKLVQFLVDGKLTAEFGHMSLVDPFVRNAELIKE